VALAHASGSDWSWLRIHPKRSTVPDRSSSGAAARLSAPAPGPDAPVRWRGESFFICQPHLREHHVDRLQRTWESRGIPQFPQSEIVLFAQKSPDLTLVNSQNHGLSSGPVVPRGDVSGPSALLQEFLNHSQRYPETMGYLPTGTLLIVIGRKHSFPEIQRQRSHSLNSARTRCSWLHYLFKCFSLMDFN